MGRVGGELFQPAEGLVQSSERVVEDNGELTQLVARVLDGQTLGKTIGADDAGALGHALQRQQRATGNGVAGERREHGRERGEAREQQDKAPKIPP